MPKGLLVSSIRVLKYIISFDFVTEAIDGKSFVILVSVPLCVVGFSVLGNRNWHKQFLIKSDIKIIEPQGELRLAIL